MPAGIILHATRSGIAGPEVDEFWRTVNYVKSGAAGLGWSCTVGPGLLAPHIAPTDWGWNAREHSYQYLAIEFAQGQLGGPISDATLDAAAYWIRKYAFAQWPDLPLTMPHHSELRAGIADGKTDVYPRGTPECDAFRNRLLSRL